MTHTLATDGFLLSQSATWGAKDGSGRDLEACPMVGATGYIYLPHALRLRGGQAAGISPRPLVWR